MQLLVSWGKQALRTARFCIKAAPIAFPRRVECNICGWQGKHFLSDRWHKYTNCPKCRSAVRHRLLLAMMDHFDAFSLRSLAAGKHILHFAPERLIEQRLRRLADRYLSADFLNPRRDLQLDISDMRRLEDHQLDLLIACDVLEHVDQDRRALREIARVLKPGGYALLTVPQKDGLDSTLEDPSITDPAAR
jgi:predicted Zn-ribbon and HTH transcriptional regulator